MKPVRLVAALALAAAVLVTAAAAVWRAGLSDPVGLSPATVAVSARPFASFSADGTPTEDEGGLRFVGGLVLRADHGDFGALSGLDVSADRLTAFADTGHLVTARIRRDAGGAPQALEDVRISALEGPQGVPYRSKWRSDAEGVARLGDALFVSLEQDGRVLRFRPEGGRSMAPSLMVRFPATVDRRSGVEALTTVQVDGRARLLAIAERGSAMDRRVAQAWLIDPATGAMGGRRVALSGGYAPTGAATLSGGDVVLLERRVDVQGAHMRLRRFPAGTITGNGVLDGPVLLEAGPGRMVDNMEGIAAFSGPGGGERLAIISDDNRFPLQRTLYLEFALTP